MASKKTQQNDKAHVPSIETIQRELGSAENIDDFFGRDGIFSRLFAKTIEQMLEAEMTAELGYEKYASAGRNSGNNRNGKRSKKLRTQTGDVEIEVPRDRNGEFHSPLLEQHASSNVLEEKIMGLYAKGVSTRDIQETMRELYGIEVSAATISTITDKVWSLVEEWQNRPLASIYPILYLDAIFIKLRQEGKVENCAVYVVLGVDLEGHRDVLGHWVGQGAEGANFWLSVVTDLQTRGVEDVFIACVDGLQGFKDAIQAVFPKAAVQRCIVHQIRNSLKYVTWDDRKAFAKDLKTIYQAPTREEAETQFLKVSETWGEQYAMAIRSWENNWDELTTMFDYPAEIRRLIYTTNAIEGYHRQVRKVTKNKAALPSPKAVRKLLFLANRNITTKWTAPMRHWAKILNQLAIRFEGRLPI